MKLNLKKDSQNNKIENALRKNLKKRKIFQNKVNKKNKEKK
jgi:hypothetical protein|tara:strand:+ start:784 stop:906 length:123 start_codon:yes stop_codon:yes gene_type:complete